MKKTFKIGAIFITVILILITIILIRNQLALIKKQHEQISKLDNDRYALNHQVLKLKNIMIDSWTYDEISPKTDSIYNEKGEKLDTKFLDSNQPVLIFRFSKVDCSDCVVQQIDVIKKMIQNDKIRYIMICDYSGIRELGMFKRMNSITNEVYNCEKFIENENITPYFCIYTKGVLHNVFFPDKDFPELTENYFNEMEKKYFK